MISHFGPRAIEPIGTLYSLQTAHTGPTWLRGGEYVYTEKALVSGASSVLMETEEDFPVYIGTRRLGEASCISHSVVVQTTIFETSLQFAPAPTDHRLALSFFKQTKSHALKI